MLPSKNLSCCNSTRKAKNKKEVKTEVSGSETHAAHRSTLWVCFCFYFEWGCELRIWPVSNNQEDKLHPSWSWSAQKNLKQVFGNMVQLFSGGGKKKTDPFSWHGVWCRNMHINDPFTHTHQVTCSSAHLPTHSFTQPLSSCPHLTGRLAPCYSLTLSPSMFSPPHPNTLFTFSVCCTFVIMLMSFPFFVIMIWWPSRHCAPLLLTPSVNPSCRFRCSSFIFVNIFSWMPAGNSSARSEISRHGIVKIDAPDAQLWPWERSARPSIIYLFACLVATTTWLGSRKVSLSRDETLLF